MSLTALLTLPAVPRTPHTPDLVRQWDSTVSLSAWSRPLLLAEMYRRGGLWRLRTVGQRYDFGLAALARGYGVDVAG